VFALGLLKESAAAIMSVSQKVFLFM